MLRRLTPALRPALPLKASPLPPGFLAIIPLPFPARSKSSKSKKPVPTLSASETPPTSPPPGPPTPVTPPPTPFRTTFDYKQKIHWYPQHQSRALRQLRNGIHQIDVVVEVRDARIPLTSRNPKFDEVLARRPRLVVYNKADLANPNMKKIIIEGFKRNSADPVIFTQGTKDEHAKRILDWALGAHFDTNAEKNMPGMWALTRLLLFVEKYREAPHRYPYMSIVIVGLPNVGKSTIINSLRRSGVSKGKVSAVGPKAGVTRAIQMRVKIWEKPPIYLVDTPGIFDPHISHPMQGLKIALTGATNDRLTEEQNVADYLLFRLNNSGLREKYPPLLNLTHPTDSISFLLTHIALTHNFLLSTHSHSSLPPPLPTTTTTSTSPFTLAFDEDDLTHSHLTTDTPSLTTPRNAEGKELDIPRAARYLIGLFREGVFGGLTLDEVSREGMERWIRGEEGKEEIGGEEGRGGGVEVVERDM
ncbi:P-loop containing nucleoside triphosphate hydrolase protein [Fimicolochytrium jonesii]|uniref:P-loop containing nucleoside triphosphate hydrolase protein n=1 Tax=Fimicolochytrium jonesii TaxID=1396493 RepID=UPI0022FECAB4|nr:P-loop containing nucleoside triphosphate hydrolase protein [Fimicolochytrium jonesii]KAI8826850.1 P-loop containing nucleoside triphosphate hydrolase protein [Fimicolochytrium jonesii]